MSPGTGGAPQRRDPSRRCLRPSSLVPACSEGRRAWPWPSGGSGNPGTRAVPRAARAAQSLCKARRSRVVARRWLTHEQPHPHALHPQHCPHEQSQVAISMLLSRGITACGGSPAARCRSSVRSRSSRCASSSTRRRMSARCRETRSRNSLETRSQWPAAHRTASSPARSSGRSSERSPTRSRSRSMSAAVYSRYPFDVRGGTGRRPADS